LCGSMEFPDEDGWFEDGKKMNELDIVYSDVLVLGSGFAGLRAADEAARNGAKVVVIDKGPRATPDIMGFNVAVEKDDSLETYEADLTRSSHAISNKALEKMLVANARVELEFLESIGLEFDRKSNGEYDVLQTLGSRFPRLVHYKALTGIEASRLMLKDCKRLGVEFHKFILIYSLLKSGERVIGAVGVDMRTGEFKAFLGKAVVLATGGCGAIYDTTTYPKGITGDGIALAYRAGGEMIDLEFMQFEPCVFIHPEKLRGKVIPTTLLRGGAKLRNGLDEEFLGNYRLDRSTVQKDTLSRAMLQEIREGRGTPHGGIYYDVSMMPRKMVVEDHAIFYNPALASGIDLMKEPAEVKPAAHTSLGGVKINEECETSLEGLYAAGEVAGGFYGANRLGGSAGIETLVFGRKAGVNAAKYASGSGYPDRNAALESIDKEEKYLFDHQDGGGTTPALESIYEEIGRIMSSKVSLIRNAKELESARAEIAALAKRLSGVPGDAVGSTKDTVLYLECRNMLDVSVMIIEASLMRTESRGAFYREDFPEKDDGKWKGNIVIRRLDGMMDISFAPIGNGNDSR